MEPNLSFDSEFRANSRGWSWPIRSILSLMVMIAVSSLSLTVMARGMRRHTTPVSPPPKKAASRVPAKVIPVPRTDRFVIVADPRIDPNMVVNADPAIDPKMVFNPESSSRQSLPIAPVAVPGNRYFFPPQGSDSGEITTPRGRSQQPR